MSEFDVVVPLKTSIVRPKALQSAKHCQLEAARVVADLLEHVSKLYQRVDKYDEHIEQIEQIAVTEQLAGSSPRSME